MAEFGRLWRKVAFSVFAIVTAPAVAQTQQPPLPVIDMHVHAGRIRSATAVPVCPGNEPMTYPATDPRDPPPSAPLMHCARPIFSPTTTHALKNGTIAELRRYNVRRAVLAGDPELVRDWGAAAPGLFVPAAVPPEYTADEIAKLLRLHETGQAAIFAELGSQYIGLPADDPQLEPFWALAEQLDVPVGIHLGEGMPGQANGARPDRYRASLTSPFQLEEVLRKHRRLRVYVMHAASPLTDDMIAMLYTYANLYVDVAANNWNMPRAQFYDQLKRLVDAGFAQRILFGSDQTIWPQGIGLAIQTIEEAPFLTAEQKRDIFYNNAARFLRLTDEEVASDHARRASWKAE
jgi:predicted TIM-barrel fold metal-dependent hydrolase